MENRFMNITALLNEKMQVSQDLKTCLANIINHQQGTQWGYEQVDIIDAYFNQLKTLDKQIGAFKGRENDLDQMKPVYIKLNDDINQILYNVKDLMNVFENRLLGAQSLVNANIKATLKAMKIKGYDGGRRRQPSTAFRLY